MLLTASADLSAELSDETVVRRVLEGERPLFELIMRRHNQRLYRLARAMLRDAHEAEDALQETYIRAFEHLSQFDGRARFSTWLFRIAINECRARIRRRRRKAALETAMTAAAPDRSNAPPPDQRACTAELGALIDQALAALPRQMRAVFVMREVEGLDTKATAECLGLTPTNVKVRLHRAREQLRSSLEQTLGQEARQLYTFDGERCDRIIHNVMGRIG